MKEEDKILGSEYYGTYPFLGIRQLVYIRDSHTKTFSIPGNIVEWRVNGRSHWVEGPSGDWNLWNRIHLKKKFKVHLLFW